jgi:hypothetical protein
MTGRYEAVKWHDVTVAIQREVEGEDFVVVVLAPDGGVIAERLVRRDAGRLVWSALIALVEQATV